MNEPPVIRSAELRAQNRHRLLSTLRRQGMCSRGELGKITGLSQAGISTLSAQLIEQGVVRVNKPEAEAEAGLQTGSQKGAHGALQARSKTRESSKPAPGKPPGTARRGRPEYNLTLAENACSVVTAELSIDLLYIAISDYSGQCIAEQNKTLNTLDLSAQEIIDTFIEAIESLLDKTQLSPLVISVSFQGVTSHKSGDFLWSPIIKARRVLMLYTICTSTNWETVLPPYCSHRGLVWACISAGLHFPARDHPGLNWGMSCTRRVEHSAVVVNAVA